MEKNAVSQTTKTCWRSWNNAQTDGILTFKIHENISVRKYWNLAVFQLLENEHITKSGEKYAVFCAAKAMLSADNN